jgi:hypothetical protein
MSLIDPARHPARLLPTILAVPGRPRRPQRRGSRPRSARAEDRRDEDRPVKGLNFFKRSEQALLRALERPQFDIRGLRRADLTAFVPGLSPAALSRQIGRMRGLGLIKRVAGAYRYTLTRLGRAAIAAACSITAMRIIPTLAAAR